MAKWKESKAAGLLRSGGLGAVALALAAMTLPADAFAQNGDRGGRWNGGQHSAQTQRAPQAQSRSNRGGNQAVQTPHRANAPQRAPNASRNWRGNDGQRGRAPAANPNRNWGGNANAAEQSRARNARIVEQQRQRENATRDNPWSGRNRSYSDPDRNRTYRPDRQRNDRDVRRNDNDHRWRNDNRGDRDQQWRNDHDRNERWRNGNRWSNNRWDNNGSHRWNRDWRRDSRYDWQRYRNNNRNIYRIGHYYAPYRNYSYRRLSTGFYLDSLFFGSRYWINDPWYYRLPPADGPFRWIRYYDDALLVDTYTGEVVDVIYNFFW
jgi:hypothetical protein